VSFKSDVNDLKDADNVAHDLKFDNTETTIFPASSLRNGGSQN
jgi:hypothetical protein